MIIYENQYRYAMTLPDANRLMFWDALTKYAFDGEEPGESSPIKPVFDLLRQGIDRSEAYSSRGRRGGQSRSAAKAATARANGAKGGRPGNNDNPSQTAKNPSENPSQTQQEPNLNPKNANADANVRSLTRTRETRAREAVSGGDPNVASETPPVAPRTDAPTLEDVLRVCRNDDCANPGGKSIPAAFGRWFFGTMEGMGWQQTNGRRVTRRNFRPFLFTWWRRADESEWAGEGSAEGGGEPSDAMLRARSLAEKARRMREDILAGKPDAKGGAK